MAAVPTKGVRTLHPDYDLYATKWKRCRDVIAGQDAMHTAAATYLPKLTDETQKDYDARLKRSDFFNGSWITIRAFVGMLSRKTPKKDVPAAIQGDLADVTMTGKSDEAFAKSLAHEALVITRFGVMVDHPPAPANVTPLTVAAAQSLKLRPRLALYPAESITNWKKQEPGGNGQYAMVVLRENYLIPEDRFSHKTETRWRVLELDAAGEYRQQVWRINDKGEDEQVGADLYPMIAGKRLNEIPFRTYGADGEETELDDPAMIDMINANVAVYQLNSDYRHGLHFTGLPTLFLAGMDPEVDANGGTKNYYIGSSAAIQASHPDAKASFIEFRGQGLTEAREAIKEKKQEMAMAGARAIMDETKQVETLGGTQIKRNGENSALANVAITVSSALEWALTFFAKWAGQDAKVVYQINRDFMPTAMDGRELTALVAAVQAGALSEQEFYELMQRGDVIDGEKPFELHQEEIKNSAPPSPAKPAVDPKAAAA